MKNPAKNLSDKTRDQPQIAALRTFVRDYPYIHIGLGLIGNTTFFIGSIFFLSEKMMIAGTWLFIIGSLGMLIDTCGSALVKWEKHLQGDDNAAVED